MNLDTGSSSAGPAFDSYQGSGLFSNRYSKVRRCSPIECELDAVVSGYVGRKSPSALSMLIGGGGVDHASDFVDLQPLPDVVMTQGAKTWCSGLSYIHKQKPCIFFQK